MTIKKLIVLSGAGVSAESGISTFRDSNGLWENHDVMEVASPEGWRRNRALVLDFYNQRRKQARECQPNAAHLALAALEKYFEVQIITQNVDDLHERAGSTNVLHLHGELSKAQSTADPKLIYPLDHWEIKEGDKCEKGSQLRPFIVWFGEAVPMMIPAMKLAKKADYFLILGTSLQVYPAAGLIDYVPQTSKKFLIDPGFSENHFGGKIHCIPKKATEGMGIFTELLLSEIEEK
ncbi:NAD-dependent deacetylase [Algoriphagus boseongensis]|uniref:NAD-dependent protein deacylase n=1 Tax=Algoriphagus boseongensis TaxID=1442587 RepID=A0A4R6T695_9BACT|nr:NAD-dependent deacetylase [Algoriphagus boseongensis]